MQLKSSAATYCQLILPTNHKSINNQQLCVPTIVTKTEVKKDEKTFEN